ncbi:MAG: helix-turn-helix transcriptional regulator [Chitinophagaceae bacterium]|nr:helix-turn-helix transcriptional regulator [Chitinophagaceae bacterium]
MKKTNKHLTGFETYIDDKYGGRGQSAREKWEQGFEAHRIGILIEEARKKMGLTQQELAQKCGTNKAYISRIENDASGIKLSTLIRIVRLGLGGELKLILP